MQRDAIIEQQAARIEELAEELAELRQQFELVCKGALGPMLNRVNGLADKQARMERAIKPRLVASN